MPLCAASSGSGVVSWLVVGRRGSRCRSRMKGQDAALVGASATWL